MRHWQQRLAWWALKMEEGAIRQGMAVASRGWKRPEHRFSFENTDEMQLFQHVDFNP